MEKEDRQCLFIYYVSSMPEVLADANNAKQMAIFTNL